MKGSALVAVALLLGFADEAHAEDRWWARDKALHFGVSSALGAGGYGAGAIWFEKRWQRDGLGVGVALTLGIGKEAYDQFDYGGASYKDLVFDVAGTATGVATAWLLDVAINGWDPRRTSSAQSPLSVSF